MNTRTAPVPKPVPATGQLTKADVLNLYAEQRYDEIEQARTSGRLKLLLEGWPDNRIRPPRAVPKQHNDAFDDTDD